MAWPVIGKAFAPAEFKAYVDSLTWGDGFRPQFLALHNTAAPSLAQRPKGLTYQHIRNLQGYYKGLGWGGGPHLFIDDVHIWVFNDLTKRGVHSPSWNGTALGIEMLGDYDRESFTSGRGLKVRANAVAAMAALNLKLGLAAGSFRFHIEDKRSDHACPGKLARCERAALVAEIEATMADYAEPAPAEPPPAKPAPIMSTAYGSRTTWAQIMAVVSIVCGVLTEWARDTWEWVLWAIGIIPAIAREAKEGLTSAQEMALWFGLNWKSIAVTIAAVCVSVAIWRHVDSKRNQVKS